MFRVRTTVKEFAREHFSRLACGLVCQTLGWLRLRVGELMDAVEQRIQLVRIVHAAGQQLSARLAVEPFVQLSAILIPENEGEIRH